jgi:2-dehydro-3-deoxygluconokinase
MRTAVITSFADNEVGLLMKDFIEQGGVDTSLICWKKTDGIGRLCRNGLNFTERGFGIRGAKGCSDRANTAISQATPDDFDFDYIFKNKSDGGSYQKFFKVTEKDYKKPKSKQNDNDSDFG